jgi:hypothetical protein
MFFSFGLVRIVQVGRFAQVLKETRDGVFPAMVLFVASRLIVEKIRIAAGIDEQVAQDFDALFDIARQARLASDSLLGFPARSVGIG